MSILLRVKIVRYSLTSDVTISDGDRIAMYRVGWSSVQEHIVFEFVPVTDATERQILFKGMALVTCRLCISNWPTD